jgi:hypothetical protein
MGFRGGQAGDFDLRNRRRPARHKASAIKNNICAEHQSFANIITHIYTSF